LNADSHPYQQLKLDYTQKKVMLCDWWDLKDILYYELLNPKETITADSYYVQLENLNLAVAEKRPALANREGIISH
jgi:hypothetical protein